MALVLALYLLLCVRVTADVCAGAAKGQIVFSADVGALMFHAQVNGHIHGRKLSMRFPLPALKKKPGAKGLRKGWTMARAVLQSAGRPDAVFHATKKTGPRPPHSRYAACT